MPLSGHEGAGEVIVTMISFLKSRQMGNNVDLILSFRSGNKVRRRQKQRPMQTWRPCLAYSGVSSVLGWMLLC
jgi:hypothetical protein